MIIICDILEREKFQNEQYWVVTFGKYSIYSDIFKYFEIGATFQFITQKWSNISKNWSGTRVERTQFKIHHYKHKIAILQINFGKAKKNSQKCDTFKHFGTEEINLMENGQFINFQILTLL